MINHGLIGLKQYVQTAMINEAKQTMFLNYVDEMIEMDCENPADYQKLMEKMLDVQTMASAINSNFQRDFCSGIRALNPYFRCENQSGNDGFRLL